MKLSRNVLRRLIESVINENEGNELELKTTRVAMLVLRSSDNPPNHSLADKQDSILAEKLSEIIGPKRVVSRENIVRFVEKKGLDLNDFPHSPDEYAKFLGIPVISGTFGKSPGYKRDKLMRYSLVIIDPEGDTIARNSTLDVSSDGRSHEQIKDGLTALCKQAGLI